MKAVKYIVMCLCLFSVTAYAKCKKCQDKGYYYEYIECPLCEGYSNISPAWLDRTTGETRWIETTYWTGIQTESNKTHKNFSFLKCPFCAHSQKKGGVKSVMFCDCSAEVSKMMVAGAKSKIKSGLKRCNMGKEELEDMMNEISDTDAIKLSVEMQSWSASGSIYVKLIKTAIKGEYDHESVHYKRDETSYKTKKFKK